jgi:hypothetical protein
MKQTVIFLIAFSLSLSAELSRFQNILSLYNGYEYLIEDRQSNFDFIYFKQDPDVIRDDSRGTSVSYHRSYLQAMMSFQKDGIQGDSASQKSSSFSIGLSIDSRERGFSERELNPQGSAAFYDEIDTIAKSFTCRGALRRNYRGYFGAAGRSGPGYASVGIDADWTISYAREENVEPGFPDSLMPSGKFIDRRIGCQGGAAVEPALGWGRQRNVSYVYYALELERELIKKGAVLFPLSDRRLARIADLLARNHTFRLRDYTRIEKFKSDLDSLLTGDEAVNRAGLRLISPFEIKDVLMHFVPGFYERPRIELYARAGIAWDAGHNDIHYPPNIWQDFTDSAFNSVHLGHDAQLGLRAVDGFAVSRYLFLVLGVSKPLVSKNTGPEFFTNGAFDWRKAADFRWTIEALFWHPRFFYLTMFTHLAIDGLPAYGVVPIQWPYRLALRETFFLEDYFSVDIEPSLLLLPRYNADTGYWTESFARPRACFQLNLRLNYRF